MAAAYQDQYLEKGTTFNAQLTLTDDTGTPYNLNGFIVESEARLSYYSANVAIEFETSIPDADNGIIILSANSATTANVYAGPVHKLVYDVILTDTGNGNVTRVLEGQIFVSPSVSR